MVRARGYVLGTIAVTAMSLGAAAVIPGASATTAPTSAAQAAQTTIFVSPSGDDANNGTSGNPVRTLGRAQELVPAVDAAMTGAARAARPTGPNRLPAPPRP